MARDIVKGIKVFEQVIGIVYILQLLGILSGLSLQKGVEKYNRNGEEGRQAVLIRESVTRLWV